MIFNSLGARRPWTSGTTVLGVGKTEPPFDILDIFKNGRRGFLYKFNDLSSLYQDAAGTTEVTGAGQKFGLVKDKSGNGIDAYQVDSSKKPLVVESAQGYEALTDGIDDFLTIDLPEIVTDSVFFAAKVRRLRLDKTYEYIFSNSGTTEVGRFSARLTSAPNSANASAQLGLEIVTNLYTSILSDVKSSELSFIASASRADKLVLYTDNSYFEKPQANTVLPTKILSPIVIGKANPTSNSWAANMRISELIVVFDAVSDDEITKIVEYLRA